MKRLFLLSVVLCLMLSPCIAYAQDTEAKNSNVFLPLIKRDVIEKYCDFWMGPVYTKVVKINGVDTQVDVQNIFVSIYKTYPSTSIYPDLYVVIPPDNDTVDPYVYPIKPSTFKIGEYIAVLDHDRSLTGYGLDPATHQVVILCDAYIDGPNSIHPGGFHPQTKDKTDNSITYLPIITAFTEGLGCFISTYPATGKTYLSIVNNSNPTADYFGVYTITSTQPVAVYSDNGLYELPVSLGQDIFAVHINTPNRIVSQGCERVVTESPQCLFFNLDNKVHMYVINIFGIPFVELVKDGAHQRYIFASGLFPNLGPIASSYDGYLIDTSSAVDLCSWSLNAQPLDPAR